MIGLLWSSAQERVSLGIPSEVVLTLNHGLSGSSRWTHCAKGATIKGLGSHNSSTLHESIQAHAG